MKVAIVLILTLCIMGLHAMPRPTGKSDKVKALAKFMKVVQEKKAEHKAANAVKAFKKVTKSGDDEDEYVPTADEIAACGADGYATAYEAALNLLDDFSLDDLECPEPGDGIWMMILRNPLMLCQMTPEELLGGFVCIKQFLYTNPIAILYSFFVEPIVDYIPPYY